MDTGVVKDDRTGTGVRSLFGRQMRFDLREGFPLVTTKRLHLKSIVHELIWFLNGDANIAYLNDAEERTGFFDRRLPYLLVAPIEAAVTKRASS